MIDHGTRYRRQTRFAPFGEAGQAKLATSSALIVGVGALGSTIAERLVRAGVGNVKLVDRDWVELDNLPRQALFTESDVRSRTPKAIAAQTRLQEINSQCRIVAEVCDVTFENIARLGAECDLLLDGTDNFETRLLMNDYALSTNKPWVHGGCLGGDGQVLAVVPQRTCCFRCLVPEVPPPGAFETCDSAGVIGPAVSIVASWQAMFAIRCLIGDETVADSKLLSIDAWHGTTRRISMPRDKLSEHCPACQGRYEFLSGERHQSALILCGRQAVQLQPSVPSEQLDLKQLANRLADVGIVEANPFLIRLTTPQNVLTIFRDGRMIVDGTEDISEARAIVAKLIGS